MIDLNQEAALTMNRARHLPMLKRDGRSPDLATLYRWTSNGCRGVVLESAQVGSSRVTTAEAVARFLRKLTATSTAPPPPKVEAIEDAERAERELAAEWDDDTRRSRGHRKRAVALARNG